MSLLNSISNIKPKIRDLISQPRFCPLNDFPVTSIIRLSAKFLVLELFKYIGNYPSGLLASGMETRRWITQLKPDKQCSANLGIAFKDWLRGMQYSQPAIDTTPTSLDQMSFFKTTWQLYRIYIWTFEKMWIKWPLVKSDNLRFGTQSFR